MARDDERLTGAALIAEERARQVKKGYCAIHDDAHDGKELVLAAGYYLNRVLGAESEYLWPWRDTKPKPCSELRALVKAGALIAAEIERRLRVGGDHG